MKYFQCKVRTATPLDEWTNLASRLKTEVRGQRVQANGKQRRAKGFYSSLAGYVEEKGIIDVVVEIMAFLENRGMHSFEVHVKDTGTSDRQSQVSRDGEVHAGR